MRWGKERRERRERVRDERTKVWNGLVSGKKKLPESRRNLKKKEEKERERKEIEGQANIKESQITLSFLPSLRAAMSSGES